MHTCFDAYLVYGVMDVDGMLLEEDWLCEKFPGMERYASSVVRGHMCSAVYGYMIGISETGDASVSEETRNEIKELYDILCKYHEKETDDKPTLGYHLVISGDYETEEHSEYNPEDAENECSDDEENASDKE